jgi:hypothetical protein
VSLGLGRLAAGEIPLKYPLEATYGSPKDAWFWLQLGLTCFVVGLASFPTAFVESAFRRAREGAWVAGLLVGVLVFAGSLVAGVFELVYMRALVETGSVVQGVRAFSEFVLFQLRTGGNHLGDEVIVLPAIVALPFVPATIGRLRAWPLRRVVIRTVMVGMVPALPFWCMVTGEGFAIWLGIVVFYALVPLVLHAADALGRQDEA